MRRRVAVSSGVTKVPESTADAAALESPVGDRAAARDADVRPKQHEPQPRAAEEGAPVDLFSRFQSKSGEFSDWLMLEEDEAVTRRPFSEALAAKLRECRDSLGTRRGGAGSPAGVQPRPGAPAARAGRPTSEWDAPRGEKPKRVVPCDSDEEVDGPRASAAPMGHGGVGDVVGGGGGDGDDDDTDDDGDDDDGDDDDEYNPEAYDTMDFLRAEAARKVATARKREGRRKNRRGGGGAPDSPTSGGVTNFIPSYRAVCFLDDPLGGTRSEGIQGDYLTFLPSKGADGEVAAQDLQAVVMVSSDVASSMEGAHGGGGGGKFAVGQSKRRRDDDEPRHRAAGSPSSPKQHRAVAVPLWCAKRLADRKGYCRHNALIALHQEIMDFVAFLRPTQAEVSMRRLIELQIRRCAKAMWPHCEPVVFGSLQTHLLLPRSDVDVTILNIPVPVEEALTALARDIRTAGMCHAAYPQVILKTKVPLVKFQAKHSLIDVDISINATDGKLNSEIVVEYLRQYVEAQPLILLIKYFLEQRGMHEPYHGGLGSFATTLLVISFLQHHPIYNDHPEQRPYTGLGKLLVDFFLYYGSYLSYGMCGISLLNGGCYFQRTDSHGGPGSPTGRGGGFGAPTQVLLEDPGNVANNAASSLRSFQSITSVFSHAYAALTADFEPPANGVEELSPDSPDITKRPTLLSRILHVDAESLKKRQCITQAYEAIKRDPANAELMAEVHAYRQEEDMPMLQGIPWPRCPYPTFR